MSTTLRGIALLALIGFLTTAAVAETTQESTPTRPKANSLTATAVPTIAIDSPEVASLLTQANDLYDQRDPNPELSQVKAAIAAYEQVLAQNPQHYEALWRLARCYWWQGDHSPKGKEIELYDKGKLYAQRAQQTAPEKEKGYYWFGVNEGRAGEIRGIFNSLFAIEPIRQAMQKVLSLTEEKDGSAHHVLGVLYRRAPGWPLSCGDINKSLDHARQAVEFSPDEVAPRVDLAKTLIAKGQKDEARKLLLEALELTGPADLIPETKKDKIKAQTILDDLK
jgi:tetratricopeptide (TPR) repeat protein